MENEKKGILYQAMDIETRKKFIRHRERRASIFETEETNNLVAYIASEECVNDLRKLIERDYTMPPPYHYRVSKNLSARKREVYAYKGNYKYLLQLIAYCMRDYEYIFSDGLYSFRSSQNAKDFLRKLKNYEHLQDYYIVKVDVSNYVASIVPERIIPKLEELFKGDDSFIDLLKYLLLRRECIERDGSVVSCNPGGLGGIPQGNLFMNVYLMDLDDYFYPRSPMYCRYSDDIIIFSQSRQEAEEYKEHVLKVIEEKELSTNPEKTCLIEPGGEVDILGFRLKDGEIDMALHSKLKFKRKIRQRANKLLRLKRVKGWSDEECGRQMVQYCTRLFFGGEQFQSLTWSRWLFPIITDTTFLKELDHYMQDAIRYCICGSMSDKRYRITYEDLQKLGYISLVHAYYHFIRPDFSNPESTDHVES